MTYDEWERGKYLFPFLYIRTKYLNNEYFTEYIKNSIDKCTLLWYNIYRKWRKSIGQIGISFGRKGQGYEGNV